MTVDASQGPVRIVGPTEGESFWQPVPANGHIRNIFAKAALGAASDYSMGTQTLPPGEFFARTPASAMSTSLFPNLKP